MAAGSRAVSPKSPKWSNGHFDCKNLLSTHFDGGLIMNIIYLLREGAAPFVQFIDVDGSKMKECLIHPK